MGKILFNLALIHCMNFCKDKHIDPSDSHLEKKPRQPTYNLISNVNKKTIVSVTFHKSHVPTYTF